MIECFIARRIQIQISAISVNGNTITTQMVVRFDGTGQPRLKKLTSTISTVPCLRLLDSGQNGKEALPRNDQNDPPQSC
jgi:hypothetical protein